MIILKLNILIWWFIFTSSSIFLYFTPIPYRISRFCVQNTELVLAFKIQLVWRNVNFHYCNNYYETSRTFNVFSGIHKFITSERIFAEECLRKKNFFLGETPGYSLSIYKFLTFIYWNCIFLEMMSWIKEASYTIKMNKRGGGDVDWENERILCENSKFNEYKKNEFSYFFCIYKSYDEYWNHHFCVILYTIPSFSLKFLSKHSCWQLTFFYVKLKWIFAFIWVFKNYSLQCLNLKLSNDQKYDEQNSGSKYCFFE